MVIRGLPLLWPFTCFRLENTLFSSVSVNADRVYLYLWSQLQVPLTAVIMVLQLDDIAMMIAC